MLKIGAVWKYENEKDGKVSISLSGNIETPCDLTIKDGTRIVLFMNKSTHEKSPFMDVFLDKPKVQRSQSNGASSLDDDVPF